MRITVFGASGKVGRLVVNELLSREHKVVAFVHSQAPFEATNNLIIKHGDVHNLADVTLAVQGSQAVVCALGSWGTKTKDILSSAMNTIIPAMEAADLHRLISLTGSGAHAPGDTISVADKISHAVFGIIAKEIITDAEKHLELLEASTLDWTVLRASVMSNATKDAYTLNNKLPAPWETISRKAVAKALVDQLTSSEFLQAAPHIHRRK